MNGNLFTIRHVFGRICGRSGIWNPECGIPNLSNTHLLEYSFFICRKSFRIYNNYFTFYFTGQNIYEALAYQRIKKPLIELFAAIQT